MRKHDVLHFFEAGVFLSAAAFWPGGPAADSQAMAIMPAAASPQVHHGLPLPSCRELKKCRITGPISSTMATISQL